MALIRSDNCNVSNLCSHTSPSRCVISHIFRRFDSFLLLSRHAMRKCPALCTWLRSHKVSNTTEYATARLRRHWIKCSGAAIQFIQVYSNVSFEKRSVVPVSPHYFHARGAFSWGVGVVAGSSMYRRRKHDSRLGPSLRHPTLHTICHGLLISPKPHDPGHGARRAQMGSRCAGAARSPWSLLLSWVGERPVSVTPSQPTNQRTSRTRPRVPA